jgi:hypothetical protein
MSKTINDLRDALFSTLQAVRDGSMDLDKARAINEISKTVIESAKVEVDFLRVTGGGESNFIQAADGSESTPDQLPNGVVGITRHLLK